MLPNNKATEFLLCILLLVGLVAPQLCVGPESSAPQPGTVPAQQGRQDGKGRSMASGSSAAASGGTQRGVAGQVVDTLKVRQLSSCITALNDCVGLVGWALAFLPGLLV